MPNYDEFRALFEDASAEQKLAILRSESKRTLSTVHGFGLLIHKLVQERGAPQMPPDFIEWCKSVVEGTRELTDLIDALTDSKHRDILRKEWEEQERVRAESIWEEEQVELAELRDYPSFIEAVKQTAIKLEVPLPQDIRITNFFCPSVMSAFSTPKRRVNIQAVLTSHNIRPLGFAVKLSVLADDEINVKEIGPEGSTKSLDEVVFVLHQWLVEEWKRERIQSEHDWMKAGIILWH